MNSALKMARLVCKLTSQGVKLTRDEGFLLLPIGASKKHGQSNIDGHFLEVRTSWRNYQKLLNLGASETPETDIAA